MPIKNLNILYRENEIKLPKWINFAFEIGAFIYEHGIKYNKPFNLLLSLPSGHFFPQFIAMGIADKTFSFKKQKSAIRKTILNLEQGSRIIYKDEQSSRKASVISVEPSPVFANEMILKIKDGKIERGIPEKQWIERVIILDEELDEIKRTRKVSKNQKLGLDNNRLLRMLYSSEQLSKVSFYPGDTFYLIGNTTQIMEPMNEKVFLYNGVHGTIGDFLYIDDTNSYTNGKLFSSQMKRNNDEISGEVPVIYSDLNSYIKQDKHFPTNPKIILSSRTDNESRLHEVKEEVQRNLLQGNRKISTNDFIEYLNTNGTQVPLGVEFIAWR